MKIRNLVKRKIIRKMFMRTQSALLCVVNVVVFKNVLKIKKNKLNKKTSEQKQTKKQTITFLLYRRNKRNKKKKYRLTNYSFK
jgi:hypothetical protein